MAKRKAPKTVSLKVPVPATATPATQAPVAHGDCFRTFLDEARSIGNECIARREFDADVIEYLREKNLFGDWAAWHTAKRTPKTPV